MTSKRKALNPRQSPLHVANPMKHPKLSAPQQVASLPLLDPQTDSFVGQTTIGISSDPMSELGSSLLSDKGFYFVVTQKPDISGFDTVVAPGFSIGQDQGKVIDKLIMKHDNCEAVFEYHEGCRRLQTFSRHLKAMREGKTAQHRLEIADSDGVPQPAMISYGPIDIPAYRPVSPSNFSRGLQEYRTVLYSVAYIEFDDEIEKATQGMQKDIHEITLKFLLILTGVASLLFLGVLWLSTKMIISLTRPFSLLLEVVKRINR